MKHLLPSISFGFFDSDRLHHWRLGLFSSSLGPFWMSIRLTKRMRAKEDISFSWVWILDR